MNKDIIPADYRLEFPWLDTSKTQPVVCCLCKGTNKAVEAFHFSINTVPFSIMHCVPDDLLYLSPQPAGNYADNLYNHPSYFTGESDMYGLAVSEEKSKAVAKMRIDEIFLLTQQPTSMLEIGCAYGHTLREARERGFVSVHGIEFSSDAVKVCQEHGLDVVLGSANDHFANLIPNTQFDVIAMYSVLEHVDNPTLFLEKTLPLLAQGGVMIIRVPRMSAQGPWLSLVDHYWHFTETSLRTLLERAGLVVEQVFPSGVFRGTQHPGDLHSMTAVARKK